MLNVPDLTLRSRAAGRVGVRQPAKTYTGPDIAQVSIYPEILEASLPLWSGNSQDSALSDKPVSEPDVAAVPGPGPNWRIPLF